MRRTTMLSLTAVTFVTAAFGGSAQGIGPGGRIGGMSLVRGTAGQADRKLFDTCDPVILRYGRYVRTCGGVPRVHRLFIGYGDFETTRRALDNRWRATTWDLWLDGHRVDLAAFGASDRLLVSFPPAGGHDAVLREWR